MILKCPCGAPATKCRQRTAYADDELNWVTLCDECYELNDEHWRDMWEDYWSVVM